MGFFAGAIPATTFNSPRHGVTCESTGGATPGVKITGVNQFSLATRNGLETGDVILTLNGIRTDTEADLKLALQRVARTTVSVPIEVLNVRTGGIERTQYSLTNEAGSYLTNFGRIDMTQMPTSTPGVSVLEGTLSFKKAGVTSQIKGTLSGNTFRGNSTMAGRAAAPFELTKDGDMFEGFVTQGKKRRFVFLKM